MWRIIIIKKWDRFIKSRNLDIEKRLLCNIRLEKQVLKKLETVFQYDIGGAKTEPKQELVSFGALYRCCICLESILELIGAGYVGSANALFRQVYEFLIWAKIAIDNDIPESLVKIHDDFYLSDGNNSGRDVLSGYYPKLKYVSDDESLDEESIKQEGRFIFKMYSQMIHGGSLAQQCPLPSEEFYKNIEDMIRETALWIVCFSGVALSYIHKCLQAVDKEYKQLEKSDDSEYLLYGDFMVGNHLSGIVYDQLDKIRTISPGMEQTRIYKIFTKTKWILEKGLL